MSDPGPDPVVGELRERISANDRAIVEAVNARLELVAELKRYKESRGIDFLDPDREESMLRDLTAANGGPLTPEGLRRLFREILALTKAEVE